MQQSVVAKGKGRLDGNARRVDKGAVKRLPRALRRLGRAEADEAKLARLTLFCAHHLDVRHLERRVGLKVLAEAALVAVLGDIFNADAGGG